MVIFVSGVTMLTFCSCIPPVWPFGVSSTQLDGTLVAMS
jgi:hypothetical protein